MEITIKNDEHKISNNCLRYNFEKPIRFFNQNISLTSIVFYNFFLI